MWQPLDLSSRVKVEMNLLGSPSLTVPVVSVDIKQHWTSYSYSDLRSCVNVEVAVLGSLSLLALWSLWT